MMPSNFHAGDADDKYAKPPRAISGQMQVTPPPCDMPDFDDKYNKSNKQRPDPLEKYNSAMSIFTSIVEKVPMQFCAAWMCFVVVCFLVLHFVLGVTFDPNMIERFGALQLEILGLSMLRRKIRLQNSVKGISGMTFLMYAATYAVRIGLSAPPNWSFEWKDVDPDVTLGAISLLLVLDIVKSIFLTHRSTYQEDIDVLKAWYIIPACWTVGILVRPHFAQWSWVFGYCWSSCLYMDVLALMPQVVMMSRSGGTVEAPIANFVAATTVSRCGDLLHSLIYLGSVRVHEPFSYWMAVSVQMVHILLVADFMYYYLKARAANGLLNMEIKLSDEV